MDPTVDVRRGRIRGLAPRGTGDPSFAHYDRSQVGECLRKHLAYSGTDHETFSEKAMDEIPRFSGGITRLSLKLSTHCSMHGAQNGHRIIDDHVVTRVIQGELS